MNRRTFCAILPAAGVLRPVHAASPAALRERLLFDQDWKFFLGDPNGAASPGFDIGSWRGVDFPHDWSIEGKIDPTNPMGSSGGFFPAGVGWYRRVFTVPSAWNGKRVSVEFEGVYMNATVYINGHDLGTHPYGYTTFFHDLTPHLKAGANNVLAVRVDQSKHRNSRWYSGSGIYRHVWLHSTDALHVAPWGAFVTTPEADAGRARVLVKTKIANESGEPSDLALQTVIYAGSGAAAGRANSNAAANREDSVEVSQEIIVDKPALWTPDAPNLYRAVTRIMRNGRAIDEVSTTFGIRSIEWSADKGFLLNGKPVKMCGGCVHHDHGPLGAAVFDRADERRIQILKDSGFNAIRTAHNPPSPALLDACDRLGMLVMEESFDCWSKGKNPFDYSVSFKDWWQRDIDAMVLRDRNHPSVVMWSIGNEVPERGEPLGAEEAKMIADYVRTLDKTRPITSALNFILGRWSDTDGYYSALDIAGYNYNLNNHAEDHKRVPSRVMACTESYPQSTFDYWTMVDKSPYIIGDFVWTAIDYLGESGLGRWYYRDPKDTSREGYGAPYPYHGADCGDIDICGNRKAIARYRNIVWNRGEKLFLGVRQAPPEGKELRVTRWGVWPVYASWTWPGMEGKPLEVEAYSRGEAVRLYLNDQLIGEKPTTPAEKFKTNFSVPYAPGVLRAVAVEGGKPIAESVLKTAGEPVQVRLTADRQSLRADGQDLSFITVEAVDRHGQPNPNAEHQVTFDLKGQGILAAVGNADLTSEEPYQGNQRRLFQGKALVVVRSSRTPGALTITATARGLRGGTTRLVSRA
ncbi:MAG TPA: glycoside hydrolase family 2 TIM barrel-domain containing protein [Bryobacteraceae bacterium]|nr:glycoside hydrolase family 2 TIM barrel-domain containing protein [Bryobacteraceae bacterium]